MVLKPASHGRNIFIYTNIQTKQVVYSLTRALNNNEALKQLPFIAKKTVPAALRKDHWTPLATVTTPSPRLGLNIYRRLREFRIMHETLDQDPKLRTMKKKDRKYVLMDQRANSVADLAASIEIEVEKLEKAAREADEAATAEAKKIAEGEKGIKGELKKKERKTGTGKTLAERAAEKKKLLQQVLQGDVVIRWKNLLDAEFARTWPARVVHQDMGELDRYSAPKPDVSKQVLAAQGEAASRKAEAQA